ncbi:MAG: photosystem II biosynthesis protein [Thermosynechococcaceae cyanobacterium]
MAANSKDTQSSAGFASGSDVRAVAEKSKKKPKETPKKASKPVKKTPKRFPTGKAENAQSAIPKVVSNRMVKRVAIISGVPSVLAFGVFPISYYASLQGWISLPPFVTLFASVACLALGLGGISYGVLSASWDEGIEGSLMGLQEFKLNLSRLRESRKAQREAQAKQK